MSMNIAPVVVYSPKYNIGFAGIEKLHPFDTRKHGRAWKRLRRCFGAKQLARWTVHPPRAVGQSELHQFHTADYLKSLRDPGVIAKALEVPPLKHLPGWMLDWFVLRHMRWSTMGTIVGAREAMRCGLAVNLSGGYHHAKANRGEGFCIYSDIALAVDDLRRSDLLKASDKVVYVDLDAHQGNGVCYAFADDPRVFIFDMYNCCIYPAFDEMSKRRIDCAVSLPHNCNTFNYLGHLKSKLPPFLDAITREGNVRFAIYNAGTDIYERDLLGGLKVSSEDVLERDRFVLEQLVNRRLPTLMLTSGGYSDESHRLIAASVRFIIERWRLGTT